MKPTTLLLALLSLTACGPQFELVPGPAGDAGPAGADGPRIHLSNTDTSIQASMPIPITLPMVWSDLVLTGRGGPPIGAELVYLEATVCNPFPDTNPSTAEILIVDFSTSEDTVGYDFTRAESGECQVDRLWLPLGSQQTIRYAAEVGQFLKPNATLRIRVLGWVSE